MFSIICTLAGSTFFGTTEEVDTETEWGYERVVPIYGRIGVMIYPKNVWKRASEIPAIDVKPLEHYPGDDTH